MFHHKTFARRAAVVLLGLTLGMGYLHDALADLLVSQNTQILRYAEHTGNFLGALFPAGSAGMDNLQGIAIGPDGGVYMASFGSRTIGRYKDGIVDVFVPPGSGGMGAPNDVAFGPDGNLYVSDGFYGTNAILRFNGKTGAYIDIFASGGGIQQPNRMAFGPCGNLFVGNATSSDVLRYHGDTGLPFPAKNQSGAIFVPGIQGPHNTTLAFAKNGNLVVASGALTGVFYYNGRTGMLLKTVTIKMSGDLTFGPDGNLYMNDYLGDSVLRYKGATGRFLGVFVAPGSGGLSRPSGLVFTDNCNPHHGSGHKSVDQDADDEPDQDAM